MGAESQVQEPPTNGACTPPESPSTNPKSKIQNPKSPIALSSGSLYTYGLARFFELARAAEAEAVEVIVDYRWDTRQAEYLLRLRDEHGLPIVALHAPFCPVRGMATDYLGCVRAAVRLAERVGAQVVVVHPEWAEQRTLAARLRRALAELQANTSVTLAVENMPYQRLVKHPRYPTCTVERLAGFPSVALDTAHCGTADLDLLAAYRALAGRVRHVHLSDFRDGREHLLPGDGALPLAAFLGALAEDGYQGIITLELCPSAMHAGKDAAVLARFRRALAFCREHFQVAGEQLVASRQPVSV
ncbi:MAG: sugar phosphate isomerase/epimerase [Chloroflexi bacterium]|nr:sugar phosphate isomerase/epimerase [Chloroflexota bacterium]